MDDPAALELLDTLQDKLRALAPESEAQHWLKSGALQVSGDLAQVRWKLAFQNVSVTRRAWGAAHSRSNRNRGEEHADGTSVTITHAACYAATAGDDREAAPD